MQENQQTAEELENGGPLFTTTDWVMATPETFNLHKEFEEEVLPILKALEAKCKEIGMPFAVRTVISQDEHGNAANMVSWLGGPTRATPELLAINSLQQFGNEYMNMLMMLMGACQDKFGGGDPEGGPDMDEALRILLGGGQ